jgi:hypothetical protein
LKKNQKNEKKQARILLYDLETFPNLGYFWAGKTWETNIIEVVKYGGLASVAWKFLGDKKVQCLTREGKKSDKQIVKKLLQLFSEADVVIAHNGMAFDTKTSNTNIIKHDKLPPVPYQQIDTKRELKKHFRFDSNSLDNAARFLGVGRKLKHEGFDMWKECMADDPSAWRKMVKYNMHDVHLLEGVYLKLRPWIKNHPHVGFMSGRPDGCPHCGSKRLKSRGIQHNRTTAKRRFSCKDCGGHSTARVAERDLQKPSVV